MAIDTNLLRRATKKGTALQIKYYPNKVAGVSLTGWRKLLPIQLYSHKGTSYFLAWFIEGSSYIGGTGYRLYLTANIKDIQEIELKQLPFAFKADEAVMTNYEHLCETLILKGAIE